MAGARPLVLSTAFILEEGTALADIGRVATGRRHGRARRPACKLVTGDTKVVDAGHGDGVYINTAGIGLVDDGVDIRPQRAAPGDVVIVSGDIGVHGVAVMSCREGLEFGTTVDSDTAPLHGLVAAMLDTGADVHVLRDPTRGGVAATLNEIARAAEVGVALDERTCPIPAEVARRLRAARARPAVRRQRGQAASRSCPPTTPTGCWPRCGRTRSGARAAVIGSCVAEHPGMVVARTGARRHPGGRPADRRTAAADLLNDLPAGAGGTLFARYAYPPNELGYCGPADTGCCTATTLATSSHAEEFDGAWPYLQAIADAAGIADPLDDDVVRSYWVGGPLLDKVDPDELLARLRSAFTGQVTGHARRHLPPDSALAHHSFHVFVVYPWVRFLGPRPDDTAAGACRTAGSAGAPSSRSTASMR